MSDIPSITLRSGPDLRALVQYLLGHQPADTVCFVYLPDTAGTVYTATYPLTPDLDVHALISHVRDSLMRSGASGVAIAAYGPSSTRPALARLLAAVADVTVVKAGFLAHTGRCFCLTCPCPESVSGIAYEPATTTVACEATLAGMVALPSRIEVRTLADPIPRQQAQTASLLSTATMPDDPMAAYQRIMHAAADTAPLTTLQVAQIAVLLTDPQVRDRALGDITRQRWQRDLWLDLTRRLPDAYLSTAANLAAICAWMRGEHQISHTVIQRILLVHPGDHMATSLDQILTAGASFEDVLGPPPQAGDRKEGRR